MSQVLPQRHPLDGVAIVFIIITVVVATSQQLAGQTVSLNGHVGAAADSGL